VRLCKLAKNVGKGGAVRKGALRARGEYVLFADADGASQAADVALLLAAIAKVQAPSPAGPVGIAVGSRAHLAEEDSTAARSPFRRFLMWCFHTLLRVLVGGLGVEDTQCGFKLFTRASAAAIFPAQHIERWAFDVELLFLGVRFGTPIVEVPITWAEVDGSKVDVVGDSLQMARDVATIRAAYTLGIWSATDAKLPAWRASDPLPEGFGKKAAAADNLPAAPQTPAASPAGSARKRRA
jgi:dolichyl-phosphate beta-glucosyltransferase